MAIGQRAGGRAVSDMAILEESGHITIIAEAGVNHNGDPELAMAMVEAAAKAGADVVKFQTFTAANVIASGTPKAAYQQRATGNGESQLDMARRLELPAGAFRALAEHCRRCGIGFLSTPFDADSVDLLLDIGVGIMKIPSGEITNLPLLRKIGAAGTDVLLSTGMATLGEIEAALAVLEDCGLERERVTVLHCCTEYPAPFEAVNLRAMDTIRQAFQVRVGYSDHTPGITVAVAAAARGATVIEKHFTLDKGLPGPDHAASLEPEELGDLVRAVRQVEAALGNGLKRPQPAEEANRLVVRRSIVAARPIRKGELLTAENLTTKRPGTGLSPMSWDSVLGTRAVRDFAPDEPITMCIPET